MKNLADAFKKYQKINASDKQIIANLNSALIRYTLPSLGFIIPERSKKRLHPYDIKLALDFAKIIPLEPDLETKLLKAQEKELSKHSLSLTNKRQQKKNLNKFIQFLKSGKKGIDRKIRSYEKYQPVKQIVEDRSFIENNKTTRKNKQKMQLSLDPNYYSDLSKDEQKYLDIIKKELHDFEEFLEFTQNSQYSRTSTIQKIKIILGWKYSQGELLKNLSLSNLIKPYNINPKINNFKTPNDYYITKGKVLDQAKEESKKLVKFINTFIHKYNINSKASKISYINGLINLAKFIYKDITDIDEYQNYEDIPVIRQLRIYSNRIKDDTKKIKLDFIEWNTVIKCLKELKRRSDLTKNAFGGKINLYSQAQHLQRFLILGFFTLIPPSRSRVIRELKIGKTLKHGLFKYGIFIPKEQLQEGEKAKYYIHLQPEDYKTGNFYGEWQGEFPNTKFADGTTFYEYLDKWIYGGMRKLLLRQENHDYLFFGNRNSKPLSITNMGERVANLFTSTIKERIYPHKLRTIFRTYLVNKGASQQELESAAFWMRHSNEIAKEVYTQQTLEQKLNPGREIAERLNSEILNNNETWPS